MLMVLLMVLLDARCNCRASVRRRELCGHAPFPRLPGRVARPFGLRSHIIPQGGLDRLVPHQLLEMGGHDERRPPLG
jgi:hypothetical protein